MKLTTVVLAAATAGTIGLGVLVIPAGASSQPSLPPVSAEDLVASVLTAKVPALGGTVTVHNALGLPPLPGVAGPLPQSLLTQPESSVRVWSDGQGHGRLALPSRSGEQDFIEDGTTLWHYDSGSRTAIALEHGGDPAHRHEPVADPTQAARDMVESVRKTSAVRVEGTGAVAGRPVYQLVLTPAPTERTLLREVRVAVDSAQRIPLQLTVLANGSPDPALQIGFSDLTIGAQDPALFRFIPPTGVTVRRPEHKPGAGPDSGPGSGPGALPAPGAPPVPDDRAERAVRVQGEGWDTVVLGQLPAPRAGAERDPLAMVQRVAHPVSGPWGQGWVVQSAVFTVLVTADRRVAAGAVPQRVLEEALTR